MSDNVTPTPYDAGWRHGWMTADARGANDQFYDPPSAFTTKYDQGWQDALDAWDIDHGAPMIPEAEWTDAQRAAMERKRAKLGADWPNR